LMTIFLASLIGIPLTAGFTGKYYLFTGLIETHNKWLVGVAILAIAMSVVSVIAYFKLIRAMYRADADGAPLAETTPLKVALIFCAVLLLAVGIFPRPLVALTQKAMAVYKTYEYGQAKPVDAGRKGGEPQTRMPPVSPGAK